MENVLSVTPHALHANIGVITVHLVGRDKHCNMDGVLHDDLKKFYLKIILLLHQNFINDRKKFIRTNLI